MTPGEPGQVALKEGAVFGRRWVEQPVVAGCIRARKTEVRVIPGETTGQVPGGVRWAAGDSTEGKLFVLKVEFEHDPQHRRERKAGRDGHRVRQRSVA